ncbi:YTH domain-containing family protein-like isoform X1 [Brassica napus]|uniref:YTH domain-containing family protein-like isoform X1 n=1 Tax=Brassica napus TaxID=3708 RepID=UPI0006AA8599|nr:YTH domain-containing family protein-like isoform X1 [Brassica napus]
MAASNRSTNSSPSTGSAKDMVERLSTDKSVLQHQMLQDTNSFRPFCGSGYPFSPSSCGINTDSFHVGGYEHAVDTPSSYRSSTDTLSFEEVYHGMRYDDMFNHGNGVPSLPQHYGDLHADDANYFAPFRSSNQQYPVPDPFHASPEFHMSQTNSTHPYRHANEINSFETDYMMHSTRNFGFRNNMFGKPKGLNLNPFTGRRTFVPMASTTRSMKHPVSAELSANDFDMGSQHRTLQDDFGSSASLSYREQAYNQCRRASFSASASSSSSPSSTWELDYIFPPLDESRSGSCSDFYHRPAMSDLLTERNRGLRASRPNAKSKMITYDQQDLLSQFRDAKFFVIKSYSEDNVYKSMKYCVWASTKNGNKKLDAAYREAKTKEVACPVFLLFSVNASAQFCGVAEMVGPVDFETSVEYWQQDRWSGHFPVKWVIVKDVPNSLFRHIIIEDNDNKPVTNSRDTQEVGVEQGIEMINIFNSCEMKSSILDDFSFYEERQRIQDRKARQRALLENLRASSLTSVPTHLASSLHEDYVREMSKSFADALVLQHKLN